MGQRSIQKVFLFIHLFIALLVLPEKECWLFLATIRAQKIIIKNCEDFGRMRADRKIVNGIVDERCNLSKHTFELQSGVSDLCTKL